jgi:hypothetical protein
LASLGGIFQASLLGLFFLLAGFLTPKSYDRKTLSTFWKERLTRLGIPLLFYILVFNPIAFYLLSVLEIEPWASYPNLQGSLLDYYLAQFESLGESIDFLTDAGPMWFLYVLLIFTFIYTLWRQIAKSDSVKRYIPKELSVPKDVYLLMLAILLGGIAFIVRLISPVDRFPLGIPFGYLTQYFMMFAVGILTARYDWFEKISKGHIKFWSSVLITTVVLFFAYFLLFLGIDADYSVVFGGPNLHALVFALVDNIACMAMIFILIPIFYLKFNRQGIFLKNLSDSSFHMYVIHPPILVAVSLVFISIPLFPVVKLTTVFLLAVVFCYLVSHYFLQRT